MCCDGVVYRGKNRAANINPLRFNYLSKDSKTHNSRIVKSYYTSWYLNGPSSLLGAFATSGDKSLWG